MRTQARHQVRPLRPLPPCPGYPECSFTMPLVVEMPGRCPKCGGRLMKRTGKSQKTGKQYTYYCCEFGTSRDEEKKCDFMTWDVPTKDDCPVCGQTMFKKAGKGLQEAVLHQPACENFLPEDKRGFVRKKAADAEAAEESARGRKKSAAKKNDRENRREEDCREKDGGEARRQVRESGRGEKDRRQKDGKEGRELMQVSVIGAGLAGCEAAWQLARAALRSRSMK